nr:hypothetical protein [Tanacetum cinerariifolium]
QTPSSGISILLAVGTPSTGSGNLYCQWELSSGSWNALCILFPTDITYSNDENNVGVEADFNNLETSIIVSPIPTIRVYKDHPVS